MAWNGSGTYSRTNGTFSGTTVWADDRDAGTKITAANHDTHDQDLATGINAALAKNGENSPTANLPMGSYKHTGVAAASGTGARTEYVSAASLQDGKIVAAADTGAADAYVVTLTPAITAYAAYQRFIFKAANANTGASTLAVNGLAATAIKKHNDQALEANDIEAAGIYEVVYDGTNFQLISPVSTQLDSADIGVSVQAYNAGISATPVVQGTHTISIPASAMIPTTTSGCAALAQVEGSNSHYSVLDFDASSDEHAFFTVPMPKSWNEGTITFQVDWTSTATDTDGVAWALQGVATGDGDALDAAYGTAVVVTDAAQSTSGDDYKTDVSAAVTIAGTPAAGDLVRFRIYRDVSDAADTMAEDARLLAVKIFYTVNAGDDS